MASAMETLARKEVILFLALAFGFSSIFYFLIPGASSNADALLLTVSLMWCPALAAILTRLHCQKSLDGFGWGPGRARWLLAGIFLPVLVGLVMFGAVWLALGAFNWQAAAQALSLSFLPTFAFMLAFNLFSAMGEELGWRGLLVPELSKFMGFTKLALLSGFVWMAWHLPLIIFGTYHGAGALWYSLAMFIPSVMGAGVVLAWLRLKSGSAWPAVLFHGFWNYFIQQFYPMLTVQTPATEMITGEFGWASPAIYILLALVAWHFRGMLPGGGSGKGKGKNKEREKEEKKLR